LNTPIIPLQPDTTGSGVSGIVQVYHSGQWGTVCHYYGNWDMNDAKVACRQLGFTTALGAWYYGRGTGKVWLNNMYCAGTETSLENCPHGSWGVVDSYCWCCVFWLHRFTSYGCLQYNYLQKTMSAFIPNCYGKYITHRLFSLTLLNYPSNYLTSLGVQYLNTLESLFRL
jgi:hypothetical protein